MKNNAKRGGGMSGGKMAALGAGVAAVGAGAYYLLGPNAKKHQRKASDLMNKMRKQVSQKVAKAKSMTKPVYDKAVDALALEYAKQYKAHEKDIKVFANKLKNEWKSAAKKAVKKSVRKIKSKINKRK